MNISGDKVKQQRLYNYIKLDIMKQNKQLTLTDWMQQNLWLQYLPSLQKHNRICHGFNTCKFSRILVFKPICHKEWI